MPRYCSLTKDPQPETISYWPQNSDFAINLSLDEAKARFGVTHWTHTLLATMEHALKFTTTERQQMQKLVKASVITEAKMAITELSAPLDGFEVVARERIKKGERLLYSGVILEELPINDSYALNTNDHVITSKEHGNIARFFAHAFSAEELIQEISFCPEFSANAVATSNFVCSRLKTETAGSYALLTATRDILPGEALRWNYGLQHFDVLKITPCLFNHSTRAVIEASTFYWKNCVVAFDDRYETGTLRPIIAGDNFSIFPGSITNKSYDLLFHANYFSEQQNVLFRQHKARLPFPNAPHDYVKCIPPNSNIKSLLTTTRDALLADFPSLIWEDRRVSDSTDLEFFSRKLRAWITQEVFAVINDIQQQLLNHGMKEDDDFMVLEDSGKHSLLLTHKAVFKYIKSMPYSSQERIQNPAQVPGTLFNHPAFEESIVSEIAMTTSALSF